MAQDLEELRAKVAAEDAAEAEKNATTEPKVDTPPQAVETETETEAAKTETEETLTVVEPEGGETEDVEDWMKSGSEPEKQFTGRDIKAAKTNLRARLEKQHNNETDELKAEIERLKNNQNAQPEAKLTRPKRDDYYESDDPEQAYDDAVLDYTLSVSKAERAAENAVRSNESQVSSKAKRISSDVEGHYERAAELTEKSGISADAYQKADLVVREMVDTIYPGNGDAVVDELISLIGKGSEKVIFNLSVNKNRLNELRARLSDDNSAMTAIAYLAGLNSELNRSVKPTSKAPAPTGILKGDKVGQGSDSSLKMAYDDAIKSNDMQAALDAKSAARRGGTNTTQW